MVQHSEAMMDSPNLTPIIKILENDLNPIDYEHPIGETTSDHRQLGYISYFEQHPPLNTIFEPPIDFSNGKASSSSRSDSDFDLIVALGLKPIFVKPI